MVVSQSELARYEELQNLAISFAREGKTLDLKAMIQAGMPVNLCDHKGNSLLMLASYNGNLETVLMLISFGAFVDKKNDRGQTPLAGVCFKGYFDIVKALVEAGANINENNGLGTTPLTFASMFGHSKIVEYINEKNQNKNFKAKVYIFFSKIIGSFRKRR